MIYYNNFHRSTMILVITFGTCSYRLRGVECLDPFFTKISKNRYKKHRVCKFRTYWDIIYYYCVLCVLVAINRYIKSNIYIFFPNITHTKIKNTKMASNGFIQCDRTSCLETRFSTCPSKLLLKHYAFRKG